MSIAYQSDQGIARLTFDRPAKKNAITAEMYEQFVTGLKQAAGDASVRAVLLSGAGGTFTAGNDLKDFSNPKFAQPDSPVLSFMQGLAAFDKPVVAAVQGMAVGIGVTMLLHCDLVYVADDATFSMPFTSLGLVPEFASTLLLPQVAGRVRASEKLLLGKPFPAHEAVVLGIANAVLPAAGVLAHAEAVAQSFTKLPPGAVRDTKRLLREGLGSSVKDAIFREASYFGPRLAGAEAREAIAAILEKRAPDFSKFQ
jgi:enoyl-CoA hydratase/carnithine racemase